jgi:hypothetical protein
MAKPHKTSYKVSIPHSKFEASEYTMNLSATLSVCQYGQGDVNSNTNWPSINTRHGDQPEAGEKEEHVAVSDSDPIAIMVWIKGPLS